MVAGASDGEEAKLDKLHPKILQAMATMARQWNLKKLQAMVRQQNLKCLQA